MSKWSIGEGIERGSRPIFLNDLLAISHWSLIALNEAVYYHVIPLLRSLLHDHSTGASSIGPSLLEWRIQSLVILAFATVLGSRLSQVIYFVKVAHLLGARAMHLSLSIPAKIFDGNVVSASELRVTGRFVVVGGACMQLSLAASLFFQFGAIKLCS